MARVIGVIVEQLLGYFFVGLQGDIRGPIVQKTC